MTPIQDVAAAYLQRGWRPIRVHAFEKKPIGAAWQNSKPEPHEFLPDDNIGIDLGRSGDLVDIDLDIPAARELAAHPRLFAHLPAFGREGETPGHRLVFCADAPKTEAALARLERPLRGFPFVDDAAKSVVLSALLSAVVRAELATCPLHVFDAPTAGSGKSKLAEMVGVLATGVGPSAVTFSADLEENEKRLATILRCGDPVIFIDNVSLDMEGDFLCQMLTQESVQARILGQSERVRLNTRSLVVATGNNMRFRGDIARRVVISRIDAMMPNPEERKFDFEPVSEVKAQRAALVMDALTILRAYLTAGKPVSLEPYGGFEDWNLIRGALVWLGRADPVETRQRAAAENSTIEERAGVLTALYEDLGVDKRVTVTEMERHGRLTEKLAALTDKPVFNRKSVGHLLRRHRDNPLMGLTLRSKQSSSKVHTWWLSGAPDAEFLALTGAASSQADAPF